MKRLALLTLAFAACGCAAPALHGPARDGDLARAQALLAAGADPNEKKNSYANETALHQAVIYSRLEMAKYLLEHGADPNAESYADSLGKRTYNGPPLMYAACKGQASMVQLLLEHGANPDPQPGRCVSGRYSQFDGDEGTPLQVAEKRGHSVVAQLLKSAIAARLGLTSGSARNSAEYGPLVGALLKDYSGEGRTIAVAGFSAADGKPSPEGAVLSERFTTELIRQKKLRVVERMEIEKVLKELKMQVSGAMDQDSAKRLGRLLGADLLLVGTVTELPGKTLEVNARLASVETGEAVSAASGRVQKDWVE